MRRRQPHRGVAAQRVAAIDAEHGEQITERDEQIKFKDAKLRSSPSNWRG